MSDNTAKCSTIVQTLTPSLAVAGLQYFLYDDFNATFLPVCLKDYFFDLQEESNSAGSVHLRRLPIRLQRSTRLQFSYFLAMMLITSIPRSYRMSQVLVLELVDDYLVFFAVLYIDTKFWSFWDHIFLSSDCIYEKRPYHYPQIDIITRECVSCQQKECFLISPRRGVL